MTTITLVPDAVDKIESAKPNLNLGHFGDVDDDVNLLQALVPGATCIEDCVAAGWPDWLALLCVHLYAEGTNDYPPEGWYQDAVAWAEDMAWVLALDVDYDIARSLFLDDMKQRGPEDPVGNVADCIKAGSAVGASAAALKCAIEAWPESRRPFHNELGWQRASLVEAIQEAAFIDRY